MSDTSAKLHSTSTLLDRPYFGVRWVRLSLAGRLPPLPCCYCVYVGSELIYIGQTSNLRDRFAYHRANSKFPKGFSIKARFGDRYGDWAMRELRLIRRLQPPMNRRIT